MGFFDSLFGKRKKSELSPEIVRAFDRISNKGNVFEERKRIMGIDTSKNNVDGPSSPNYGLCPENPVFVNGPLGTDRYLMYLRTTKGEELQWDRLGSTSSSNVSGAVDIYSGRLSSGETYITIYICWYGDSISNVAPDGLVSIRPSR